MLKNVKNGEFGLEGEVYIDIFKIDIRFIALDENVTVDYIEKCAKYLNALNDYLIGHLCEASVRYCNDSLEIIGEDPWEFNNCRAVLNRISPSVLIIQLPQNGDEPVVHMELNCEWEEEHGMEWIIRNDKVLYVGSFNGQNPWADYSVKDSWNFA